MWNFLKHQIYGCRSKTGVTKVGAKGRRENGEKQVNGHKVANI